MKKLNLAFLCCFFEGMGAGSWELEDLNFWFRIFS